MNKKLFLLAVFIYQLFTTSMIAGQFDWARSVLGAHRGFYPYEMKVDTRGNTIIGGYGNYCLACVAGYISKFDSLGNQKFYYVINGTSSGNIIPSVGVDDNSNIYFVSNVYSSGITFGPNTINNSAGYNWVLVKLDSTGQMLWFTGLQGFYNNVKIDVDGAGNTFLTTDDSLYRYSTAGAIQWQVAINANKVDVNGNQLVVANNSTLFRVSKSNGAVLSSINIGSHSSLTLASNGDVFFTGNSGSGKVKNTVVAWQNQLLKGVSIASYGNKLWTLASASLNSNDEDTAMLIQSDTSGLFITSDTIFNADAHFIVSDNSGKIMTTVDWSDPIKPTTCKPWIVYASINVNYNGYILGRFSSVNKANFNFVDPVWTPNGIYSGNWVSRQCPGGNSFPVKYEYYNGTFNSGNIIFVELSDSLGNFGVTTVIGAISTTNITGAITCQIPPNIKYSLGYKMRLRTTSPVLTSLQESDPLRISAPTGTISTIQGTTTFCFKDDTLTTTTSVLSGSCCYLNSYQWYKNGVAIFNTNNQWYVPSSSGTYTCVYTDDGGCSRQSSNQLNLTVKALPNTSVTPNGQQEVCSGDSLALSVPFNPGYTYQWFKANTALTSQLSNVYQAKTTGNYKVKVTGTNGCTKTSLAVKVTQYKPVIQAFGPTAFCAGGNVVLGATNGTTTAWQWIRNNNDIIGQNNQFFTAAQAGYYKLRGTAPSGCTALSNSIQVIVNCREGLEESDLLTLYPSPANDLLNISFNGKASITSIQIFNLQGQLVLDSHLEDQLTELDISELSSGAYLIVVEDMGGNKTYDKFLKN
jgi:hypothetical protein